MFFLREYRLRDSKIYCVLNDRSDDELHFYGTDVSASLRGFVNPDLACRSVTFLAVISRHDFQTVPVLNCITRGNENSAGYNREVIRRRNRAKD